MKLYKKELRPMVQPPSLQGFNSDPYPFYTEDSWIVEDFRDYFQHSCEEKLEDPMSTIVFDERYVEVELPTPEVLDVKPGNIICFKFNPDKCDIDIAVDYANLLKGIVPDSVGVMLMPNINVELMDKETAYAFIEQMKREVNKLYGTEESKGTDGN